MKKINRRNFLKGIGLVSVAGLGGLQLGFANTLLKGGSGGSGRDLLVYVFLNGGMDGLNMIPPRQIGLVLRIPNVTENSQDRMAKK